MAGFFSPSHANKITGIGSALSQLAQGNAVDLTPYLELDRQGKEQEALKQSMQDPALLEKFTPEQRKILATLPPEAAQKVIAQIMFAPPEDKKETFRDLTPEEVQARGLPAGGYYQVNEVTGELKTPVDAPKPDTGETFRELTPEEVAAKKLDQSKAYQISEKTGRVYPIGGGGININTANPNDLPGLSKLPEGQTYVYEDDGSVKRDERGVPMVEWMPGTKGAAEAAKTAARNVSRTSEEEAQGNNVDYMLNDVITKASRNPTTTGLAGDITGRISGTPAYDLKEQVSTLQSVFSFEKLQEIRDNSETGGGLGNVTDADLRMLANNIASLDTNQSGEQLLQNLIHVQDVWRELLGRTPKSGPTPPVKEYIWNPETGEIE